MSNASAGYTGSTEMMLALPKGEGKPYGTVFATVNWLEGRISNITAFGGFFVLNPQLTNGGTFTYYTVNIEGFADPTRPTIVNAKLTPHVVANGIDRVGEQFDAKVDIAVTA